MEKSERLKLEKAEREAAEAEKKAHHHISKEDRLETMRQHRAEQSAAGGTVYISTVCIHSVYPQYYHSVCTVLP
jgi:hypothetical protein